MPRTQRLTQGAVVARLLLDICGAITDGMGMAGAPDASCADVVLLCAVMIGHAEGRPMTAAKIGAYVGIPRPTAIRRLQEMMDSGIIHHDARKRWKMLTSDSARRDLIDSVIVANTQHIRRAMDALSKLDGMEIAQRDDLELRPSHGDAK
jgi:hypothetical protein